MIVEHVAGRGSTYIIAVLRFYGMYVWLGARLPSHPTYCTNCRLHWYACPAALEAFAQNRYPKQRTWHDTTDTHYFRSHLVAKCSAV